jgi:hypothetical protein
LTQDKTFWVDEFEKNDGWLKGHEKKMAKGQE